MKLAKVALFGTALAVSGALSIGMIGSADVGARTLAKSNQKPVSGIRWNAAVTRTAGGHVIGNPAAEAKVTEYVSYTCPHCAAFAVQGDAALKLIYIPSGKVSVEVRHVIRDPIDWTAAVLANCGEPDKFAQNHAAFMNGQKVWLEIARKATPGQQARWGNPDRKAARKAIASDLGFEEIMERRGYSRVEINKCLTDDEAAIQLVMQSMEEVKRMGVSGTPSFALNGDILKGTHSWPILQQNIDAFLDAKKSE